MALTQTLRALFGFGRRTKSRRYCRAVRRSTRPLIFEPLENRALLSADFGFAFRIGGPGNEFYNAVAADAAGNVYAAGYFTGTVDFDPGPGTFNRTSAGAEEIYAAKYSPAGALLWARSIGEPGNDTARAMALDPAGNLYVTGIFEGTIDFDPGPGVSRLTADAKGDAFVWKLDSGGNFVWARSAGGGEANPGESIAVDAAGNVYAAIGFTGTADFDPGPGTFNLTGAGEQVGVWKLDSTGNFVWARRLGHRPTGIAVDPAGNVYTSGILFDGGSADYDPGPEEYILTSAGEADGFVSKLDADGNFVWAHLLGGTGGDAAFEVAVDSAGLVYLTGSFSGTVDFDPGPGTHHLTSAGSRDVYVGKLSSAGELIWARAMGGTANDDGDGGIAVDAAGNVYTSGTFSATADFDPGPGAFNLSSAGSQDIFVSKLDSSGAFTWAVGVGGPGSEDYSGNGNSISLDGAGNIFLTGFFSGTADFDPGPETHNLTSAGGFDIFVSKLIQQPVTVHVQIDVKPGGGNPINLKSQGVLPVAILSTADFNALHIDRTTVKLGDPNLGVETAAIRSIYEDVDGDGDLDLLVFFRIPDLVADGALDEHTEELALTGKLLEAFGGAGILGSDAVRIVPKAK